MSDLVGNPEDRFSHNEAKKKSDAQRTANLHFSRHPSFFRNDFQMLLAGKEGEIYPPHRALGHIKLRSHSAGLRPRFTPAFPAQRGVGANMYQFLKCILRSV